MPGILKVAGGPHLTRVKPAAGLEEGFDFRAAGARRHAALSRACHPRHCAPARDQPPGRAPEALLRQRKNARCGGASVSALHPHQRGVEMSKARVATALLAGLMSAIAFPALAEKPLPVATPAEQAVLQKFVGAYMASLPDNEYYDVMAEDVFKRIKAGKADFVVVDVRVPKDKKFDKGHIPGAIFIGVMDLARPESLALLPKDKDIIVHCDTGQQQNKAVTALRLLGYKAYAMKWGYMAWSPAPPTALTLEAVQKSITAGFPVEK
jgi:rhodanese-related sulfurtransferase